MAEPDRAMSEESGEEGEPLGVRDRLVFKFGRTEVNYQIGVVPCAAAGTTSAIICIAELGGRLIVAVPQEAWHRTVVKRMLPSTALGKALSVEVVGALPQNMSEPLPEFTLKLWVGVLSMEVEGLIEFEGDAAVPSIGFGRVLPYAEALVKVSDEQFAFTSAESGGGGDGIFKRMTAVEAGLLELKGLIQDLGKDKVPAEHPRKAKAKIVPRPSRGLVQGLDPGTVAAARAAGVDEEALGEMGKLLGTKRNRKLDEPGFVPQAGRSILEGELNEEPWEPAQPAGDAGEGSHVEAAVLQLTKIVSNLAQSSRPKGELESILDSGAASGSGESQTIGAGRKNAAALRQLTRLFEENPRDEAIEKQMQNDFQVSPPRPGVPHPTDAGFTARGWLATRSRMQNFQNHIRWSWCMAGVWDDLRQGNHERARARAALMTAAADQASIDGGSWLMSTVSLLEPIPPYQDFSRHTAPTATESQVSALYDVRWADIFLGVLRERDLYTDMKKKLQAGRKDNANKDQQQNQDVATPKGGGRGRGGKGREGSGSQDGAKQ